jgi:hypothetical protein
MSIASHATRALPFGSDVFEVIFWNMLSSPTHPDAGRPTVVTASCTNSSAPTYAKSSWTSKVNPILITGPFPSHENGILLHTPSYDISRFTSTSTEIWKEARSLKSDIIEAWRRRRKKQRQRYYRCTTSGTTATHRYYRLGYRHGPVFARSSGAQENQRANLGPAVVAGTYGGTTAGPGSPNTPESREQIRAQR